MSSAPSSDLLVRIDSAKRAVLAQTDRLHRDFGQAASEWKYDGSRVTAVDVAISERLFEELRLLYPEDDYFSEELAGAPGPIPASARFAWVLDPIDGTNNYALGIAHCAIALALFEHGVPVYGVIYDLSRRTLMHGGPGFGVFDGDRAVRVRTDPPGVQTLIGFHTPMDKSRASDAEKVVREFKIRGLGSSTLHLAYVGVGILDGTVDHNVKIWDIAAAIPLVWAGGGKVEFLNGEQFPLRAFDLRMGRIFYVAGNEAVCRRLKDVLGI